MRMIKYESDQVLLAHDRYTIAANGITKQHFLQWLGYRVVPEVSWAAYGVPPMNCIEGDTNDKIQACLSPHWYALIRASLIKEETCPQ